MIFFDLDDTLLYSESAHKVAVKKIFDDYSLDVVPEEVFSEWLTPNKSAINWKRIISYSIVLCIILIPNCLWRIMTRRKQDLFVVSLNNIFMVYDYN